MVIDTKNIKVSIVVPIYRIEAYLSSCVDSILNQTHRNIEVILVDDGSDDDCPKICDKYALRDSRVYVIHKQNGGLTSARKAGTSVASGEYVLYVDGDDWIEAEYVEKMLEPMASERVDVVGNIAVYMNYSDGRQLERSTPMKEGQYSGRELIEKVYPNYICMDRFYETSLSANVYLYLFRREFLMDIQEQVEDEITIGEDMALTFRGLLIAKSLAVIKYFGYHYRQHPNSMIHKRDMDHFKRIEILYRNLKKAVNNSENRERAMIMSRKIPRCIFFNLWIGAPVNFARISDEFLFPFYEVKNGSKLIVYGMGVVGRGIMEAIVSDHRFELVGCSDQGWSAYSGELVIEEGKTCTVYKPQKIKTCDFDYVVIGVSRYRFRQEIHSMLVEYGVPESKIASIDESLFVEENLPFS